MPDVKLKDGRIIRFKGNPTQEDIGNVIDEVASKQQAEVPPPARQPTTTEKILMKSQRVGRIGTAFEKGVLGDIPFLRKVLPKQVQEFEPETGLEKGITGGTRLVRDISLLRGIEGLRGIKGAAKVAGRGALFGAVTAETEDPEEIIKQAAITGAALPVLNAGARLATALVSKVVRKGIKTSQQAIQDLVRAGFTTEKSTVERVQLKGLENIFSKKVNPKLGVSNRDARAPLNLAETIFNNAQKLRKQAGQIVGRARNFVLKDPRIKVSLDKARTQFQTEISQPSVEAFDRFDPLRLAANEKLRNLNALLAQEVEAVTPERAFKIIDLIDDMLSGSRQGTLGLSTNEGRVVAQLRRNIKEQILRSVPRNTSKILRAADTKFSKVAEATDDMFNQLPLRKEGAAKREVLGAAEKNITKALKKETPTQIQEVFKKLDNLLPQGEKFLETLKDVVAAQDLQREGVGFLLRRLFLAPRISATALGAAQKVGRTIGTGVGTTGRLGTLAIPPQARRIRQ